jgi:serine/threonine protein kinase/tetratricopeptide (TPR) repeat protein
MSDNHPSAADRFGQIADEFVAAIRQGQRPSVEEFARRYPEQADEIREMLPALMVMEKARSADDSPAQGRAQGSAATAPLQQLGDYQILREVGRGGMGVVYKAQQLSLGRHVAIKVLSERYPPDSPHAQRFLSEARITGQLQHPGIPAVHQVGALADGRPFLAMKLIKGSTLTAILKQRTDPSADRGRLLAIFEAVCQAVGYAHAHRVIHRDLKPANVMVGAFGEVQVMDWGLAKVLGEETPATTDALAAEQTRTCTQFSPAPEAGSHTQAGSLVGTAAFIPPEQAIGQLDRVNERSDVFGLGAVLAVILTGKPPYVGENAEAVRVQAVRGKLEDCFGRLDASGAEPELVALCKQCLAFEPADRPADGGAVAQAVAGLRAAADERARRAELERVRALGEQATALARSAERQKRRRLVIGAAAVLAVAAVGGLAAVLAVQQRANAALAAKNAALADEHAKVEARFELAQRAIALFHTGVSEDALLKNAEFKELRKKLLKEAADFYADLEKLLAGETDLKSRQALATAYFQLGELTDKIASKREALAVHRKALALRRELAAAEGANVETRLDVARSLEKVGRLLSATGDNTGALAAVEQQRDLAERLEAEHPTDAVRSVLAQSHHCIGGAHYLMGKPAEALTAWRKALAIWQKLADANPAVTEFQRDLATGHHYIGLVLTQMGKWEAAMEAFRKASASRQKLADANPAVTEFQRDLATSHHRIGLELTQMGKWEAAMEAFRKALAIRQKVADDNPAVTAFQRDLAISHHRLGFVLAQTGKWEAAMEAYLKTIAIFQKLADANPTVPEYQRELARAHNNVGRLLARQQRFAEAFTALDAGLAICQKLAETDRKSTEYTNHLGYNHAYRGWALVRSGQPSQAAADLRRGLELWAKVPAPDPETQFERSRALALLAGLGADAKSGVTPAEAARLADQAVASLRDAISAGWGWPDELKEPDFDALRGRDDFKKLQAEVEARHKADTAKQKDAGSK